MKTIITINTDLPNTDTEEYLSGASLSDYDIVVFDPKYPYLSRIHFSDGGSCIDIESSSRLAKAMRHWAEEIRNALVVGKTVFILLNESETDSIATGSSNPRKGLTNYNTAHVKNYDALPVSLKFRNAKGRRMKVPDSNFKSLFDVIKEVVEYRVIVESKLDKQVFTTNDGTGIVGGIHTLEGLPGHLVLLPYFDISGMTEDRDGGEFWTEDAERISNRIIGQLVSIDEVLKSEVEGTPRPDWVENEDLPVEITGINKEISALDDQIEELKQQKGEKLGQKEQLLAYTALLYETGNRLELAIENALKLMSYEVENFRDGDLEIDHVIVGPSGLRMIGEAEGKDSAAIGISKFRQLESNINEDFERDEVEVHAKGILFGNGYRLVSPDKRDGEFTSKCQTNAKRLGTALVRTSDLYRVALHILDNPKDEKFKEECRQALEATTGEVVTFPIPSVG